MKTIAIVQARMGATRFPNKVMQPILGRPMIELLLERLSRSQLIDQVVLATSVDERNLPLVEHVRGLGYAVCQGSENDVLDRYYQAAISCEADVVVRITGDCPLIDPAVVDDVIAAYRRNAADYACNTFPPTYPDGLDTEVFSFTALQSAWQDAFLPPQREHVTPYIRESGRFRVLNVPYREDHSGQRWTVDEPEDIEVIKAIFEHFSPRTDFGWQEVLQMAQEQPDLFVANRELTRNQGEALGTGQKLWKRAKRIIPDGSMLLSKRAEMFLPEQWPAYFSKAKGCRV
ncbi:MAG TPA: glycosyltransferase family protein, partial [Anaerolineae bacterium]|nr:glycosyltransferase family protein [Anaerolineae bacterium]